MDNISAFQIAQTVHQLRNQRLQVISVIRHRGEDYDRNVGIGYVLLVWKASVNGYESIELIPCQRQEFTVVFATPSHVLSRPHFVCWQIAP